MPRNAILSGLLQENHKRKRTRHGTKQQYNTGAKRQAFNFTTYGSVFVVPSDSWPMSWLYKDENGANPISMGFATLWLCIPTGGGPGSAWNYAVNGTGITSRAAAACHGAARIPVMGFHNRPVPLVTHATEPIHDRLCELQPLSASIVEIGAEALRLFNCLLHHYHYRLVRRFIRQRRNLWVINIRLARFCPINSTFTGLFCSIFFGATYST